MQTLVDLRILQMKGKLKDTGESVECHGPDIATNLLRRHCDNEDIIHGVGVMCKAAATGCEESKCKLMDSDFSREVLRLVSGGRFQLCTCMELICALQALITPDDDRPPASKALMHARLLALDRGAVDVFVSTFHRALADNTSALPGIIGATQQLCANDEICKQVRSRSGGLCQHRSDDILAIKPRGL
jgi:armadillo repeat-containing protein 6